MAQRRPSDGWGRPSLARLTAFPLIGAMVRDGLSCREVPDDFWLLELDERERAWAIIACPCGQEPRAELGRYPVSCECERWFFYTGTAVLALNGPAAE